MRILRLFQSLCNVTHFSELLPQWRRLKPKTGGRNRWAAGCAAGAGRGVNRRRGRIGSSRRGGGRFLSFHKLLDRPANDAGSNGVAVYERVFYLGTSNVRFREIDTT